MKDMVQVKAQRNYGIDLLRIVAMLYMVILHTLEGGGILDNLSDGSWQHQIAWLMEIWALCAVNIFGMISGYVGYTEQEKKFSYSNFLVLWLQVVFYGGLLTFLFYQHDPALVTKEHILKTFFPIVSVEYWYFTAYAGLILIIPFLNTAVRGMKESALKRLFVGLLVFSCFEWVTRNWYMINGYSFGWLVMLYVLGAILKKSRIGENIPAGLAAAGIVVCSLAAWAWKQFGSDFEILMFQVFREQCRYDYLIPTCILSAFFHVILFSRIRIKMLKPVIAFAAPGAFTIYLLNAHPLLFNQLLKGHFVSLAHSSPIGLAAKVILFAFAFAAGAVLIDSMRRLLFRLLYVKQAAEAVTGWVEKALSRILR